MLKFKKQKLVYVFGAIALLLALAVLIPASRAPVLNAFKYPLEFLTFVKREVEGLIFYHRNFVQNEELSKKNDFLHYKLNELVEIYQENKRLKNLLSLKQKSPYKVIGARVIARTPDNWSSAMIIDKGLHHGIKRGFIVVNYRGLVGRVAEATDFTSKVMLANDSAFGVSAVDQRSRQEGLVSGSLGSYLLMRYLPKDADVQVSDAVVTSGLTALYPKGLLIGTIVEVRNELSGLSRYCLIKPAVNLSSLEEVLVIVR